MAVPNDPTISNLASGGQFVNAPIFGPEQMTRQSQLLELGGERLANPTAGFNPIAQQANREFYTRTVPSLAEHFTAQGGGQRSSAFQGALGQAGADLQSQLAGQQAQYGLQQQGLATQQLALGLQPQYGQAYYQPQGNEELIGKLGEAGTDALSAYLKAPGGSAKEKLKNVLGIGGEAATGAVAGKAAQSLTDKLKGAPASTATNAIEAAAPAVTGAAAGVAAGKALTSAGTPAAIAAKNAALAKAGLAATGTAAAGKTAATSALIPAAAKLGIEAAIAPTLAAVGAVAMPLAMLGLIGFMAYKFFED